ncbi:hypothetical protein ON010_g16432 [Phytophthora cinnamomi]|nr:hypothetical protein ON010_g16432 [Phytophthora cinnamomi]
MDPSVADADSGRCRGVNSGDGQLDEADVRAGRRPKNDGWHGSGPGMVDGAEGPLLGGSTERRVAQRQYERAVVGGFRRVDVEAARVRTK